MKKLMKFTHQSNGSLHNDPNNHHHNSSLRVTSEEAYMDEYTGQGKARGGAIKGLLGDFKDDSNVYDSMAFISDNYADPITDDYQKSFLYTRQE